MKWTEQQQRKINFNSEKWRGEYKNNKSRNWIYSSSDEFGDDTSVVSVSFVRQRSHPSNSIYSCKYWHIVRSGQRPHVWSEHKSQGVWVKWRLIKLDHILRLQNCRLSNMCGVRPEFDAWGDFIVVETTTTLNEKHVKQSFPPPHFNWNSILELP